MTISWYGWGTGAVPITAPNRIAFTGAYTASASTPVSGGSAAFPTHTFVATSDGVPSGSSYGLYSCSFEPASQQTTIYNPAHTAFWQYDLFELADVPSTRLPLRVVIGHTSPISLRNVYFWAYDGSTDTVPPSDVVCIAFERGVGQPWPQISPTNKLSLQAKPTAAAAHTYYLGVSAIPTTAGVKTAFAFKISFEYY